MSAVAYLLSGAALVGSALLYKHAAGMTRGTAPEETAPPSTRGEARPRDDPWRASFSHLHPLVDSQGEPVTVTADTVAKSRRQLAVGGTILPRRPLDSQRTTPSS